VRVPNSSGTEALRRLGKNIDHYSGETIDLPAVLRDCVEAGVKHGWTISEVAVNEQLSLPVFTRAGHIVGTSDPASQEATLRVYVSAGIHGDEPAGPLAVRQLLQADAWPAGPGYWICPCLNPGGFRLHRRENPEGLDLNANTSNRRRPKPVPTSPGSKANLTSICVYASMKIGNRTDSISTN